MPQVFPPLVASPMTPVTVYDDASNAVYEAMTILEEYGITFDTVPTSEPWEGWVVQFGNWPSSVWEDTLEGVERECRRLNGLDNTGEF